MELGVQILTKILSEEKIQITFPNLKLSAKEILEIKSYQALKQIREILSDPELEDEECFRKIEKLVMQFEEMGSDCGTRHDFG